LDPELFPDGLDSSALKKTQQGFIGYWCSGVYFLLVHRSRDARLDHLYGLAVLFSDRTRSNIQAYSTAHCAAYSTADCAKSKPHSTSNSTANGQAYNPSHSQAYLSSYTSAEQRPHPVSYLITHYIQTYSATFTSPDGTANLCAA
jgi:hypothetical protein